MKTDDLEKLFKTLDFDVAEPAGGHEQRFQEKLRNHKKKKVKSSGVISMWLPGLAIAASFLIAVMMFPGAFTRSFDQQQELAQVSPEMRETQNFYASVIKQELENLQGERTPETKIIIEDALEQLQILENDYTKLKKDLANSGQDKRVIYAMISNFQQRIDLLNTVLEKVNTINTLKNKSYENKVL